MKEQKQTILEWYQQTNQNIDAPCNGKGECGRCKIKFLENPPSVSKKDLKLLSEEEIKQGIRLACTTKKTEQENFIPMDSFLQQDIFVPNVNQTQQINQKYVNNKKEIYGIALDIGTTTLAMSLIGLSTGECFATITRVNHQRNFGADVISRIQAANDGKLSQLQQVILQDILEMLLSIQKEAKIETSQIKRMVIAGNTTMCHLLRGLSCEGLSQAPFQSVSIELVKMKIKELWRNFHFEENEILQENHLDEVRMKEFLEELTGYVTIFPGISAFIGGDIVAGMYACDMDLQEEVQMLLDVGTNGEMVIGNKERFFVTSAPAGPVFEGGAISCGMPAVDGAVFAIESREVKQKLLWSYQILGTEKTRAKGICGSGLVDLAAELWKRGIIDENGTLDDEHFESGFLLPMELEENQIILTQADIRELQMGKAAIRAGIELLIKKSEEKPKKWYLSGGFGTAIQKEAAGRIGLFPKEYIEQITPMGNTALLGAVKYLLDKDGELRVKKIVKLAEEIYLAREVDFEEKYILFMQFLV